MDFNRAFTFLGKLAKNNNREWFEKNKESYLEIKESFEEFAAEIYEALSHFDPSLLGQDPRKLVFRIYRDVRFSKDKRPYKKFLSAGFSAQGKGTGAPGYYLQLEPGNKSFICAGLYGPASDALAKIRQEIDYNGGALAKLLSDKKFNKYYDGFWEGDPLKTAPKGFAKDHPHIEWLRLRHYVIMHSFADAEVRDQRFLKILIEVMKTGKPLNDFLKHALE